MGTNDHVYRFHVILNYARICWARICRKCGDRKWTSLFGVDELDENLDRRHGSTRFFKASEDDGFFGQVHDATQGKERLPVADIFLIDIENG